MAQTVEELLELKEKKLESLAQKTAQINDLNQYFSENKYPILWAQINPIKEGTKNKINTYLQVLEDVLPAELSGIPLKDTVLGKTSTKSAGLLLARAALKFLVNRFVTNKSKPHKKKKKSLKPTQEKTALAKGT